MYDNALNYCDEALVTCRKINKPGILAKVYSLKSAICADLSDYETAIETQLESIKIREEIKDQENLANSYLDIGIIFNDLEKTMSALSYLEKSKNLFEKYKKEEGLSKVYIALGYNYGLQNKPDSSLAFYRKSLALKNKLNLDNKEIVLNNIGAIFELKKNYSLAEDYYKKSIKLAEKKNNQKQLAVSYYNIGRLYRKQGKYKRALEFLETSLLISKKYKSDLVRLQLLVTIGETYESLGNFKESSKYNEKHIVLRDSIETQYKAAEEVQLKYEAEKQRNKAEKKEKTMLLIASIITLILSFLSFFAVLYAIKSKKAKEKAEQKQKLAAQKNIDLLKKQELKTIKAMLNGQETERKRIAQDLHDRLGSILSMVKLNYKSIEDNLDKLKDENKKQYSQANALLDEACNAVRDIAHNMVSGVLSKFGLVAALEDLKNTISGTNTFQLELITHGLDDRLENNVEIELYGIVQELIHNVIKHAKAKEVSVQLLKLPNSINLTVIDDGIGFNYIEESQDSGMGLKSVASRVNELKGTLEIDSGKGNGTTINIEIPF